MGFESFDLTFESKDNEEDFGCSFRKYENNPLIMICFIGSSGEFG